MSRDRKIGQTAEDYWTEAEALAAADETAARELWAKLYMPSIDVGAIARDLAPTNVPPFGEASRRLRKMGFRLTPEAEQEADRAAYEYARQVEQNIHEDNAVNWVQSVAEEVKPESADVLHEAVHDRIPRPLTDAEAVRISRAIASVWATLKGKERAA